MRKRAMIYSVQYLKIALRLLFSGWTLVRCLAESKCPRRGMTGPKVFRA